MPRLSGEQLRRYGRDGIVFPLTVLSAEEAASFRAALESVAAGCGLSAPRRFDGLHLFFDWAYRLATHAPLVDAVEDLLGPDILIDGTLVFYKHPRDASYASWHQDSVYSGWHLTPSTSAWVALTASHRANGCMRVIPGSHTEGLLEHDTVRDDPHLLNKRGERISRDVDESRAVDVVLRAGEMSLHQSNIIHGSQPNTSDEPRVGFIVRFVTDRVAPRDRPLLRVRGEADCSHLRLVGPPPAANQQAALAAWCEYSEHRHGGAP
ncbi:MAG TPA: phytanoyl-CoA dioxygenase family protein [Pyrinomonadaceae bacterium]|jgi:ectoine hydroxylase-related dioxygenase (phytanoyl-CoA dioxygenase family)